MTKTPPSKDPLDPKSPNLSQNSEQHAATTIQSSVTPEDYPAAERAGQTAVVGKPKSSKPQGRKG